MGCASLATARVDPPPVDPCKTKNEPKKVNGPLLDEKIFNCSAIAGRQGGPRHLEAMVCLVVHFSDLQQNKKED